MENSKVALRKMDDQNRIVIPKNIRDELSFKENQEVDIFLVNGDIVIAKRINGCYFCGMVGNFVKCKDKLICSYCIQMMKKSMEEEIEKKTT